MDLAGSCNFCDQNVDYKGQRLTVCSGYFVVGHSSKVSFWAIGKII